MGSATNDPVVKVAAQNAAATSGKVFICARCGGILGLRATDEPEKHTELECIGVLRRELFAAHKRIRVLEGREEV